MIWIILKLELDFVDSCLHYLMSQATPKSIQKHTMQVVSLLARYHGISIYCNNPLSLVTS